MHGQELPTGRQVTVEDALPADWESHSHPGGQGGIGGEPPVDHLLAMAQFR
jgi:hypothetical protein